MNKRKKERKKERKGTKIYGLEVGVKTKCNVGCHVPLRILKKKLTQLNLFNKLTYFISRKNLFIYSFLKENVAI